MEVDDAAIDNTVTKYSVCLFQSEKSVSKSASSPATKVPHFCSKEVYFIQIPFSAFTLLLKSETKNIFSGIDFFFFTFLWLVRMYHLEVLQVEMHIKTSFDFQKPSIGRAAGILIILSCTSYHLGILLIKQCSINKQIIEVSREAVDLNHDSCSFIFVLTRQ